MRSLRAAATRPILVPRRSDLGPKDGGEYRADTRDRLNGVEAQIAGENGGDLSFDHGDLAIEMFDQVTQALHPDAVGVGELDLVEEVLAGDPEQIAHRYVHPLLGEDSVDLCFEVGTQVEQLGAVTGVFTEFSLRWWGEAASLQVPSISSPWILGAAESSAQYRLFRPRS